MTRPQSYGSTGAAITAGMTILHAAERSDFRQVHGRGLMAKVAYGRPEPLQTPFEIARSGCAGPDDDDRPACEGLSPDLFFPEGNRDPAETAMVREVCFRCPRRARCQQDGTAEEYGIWAGQTATERAFLRGARRKAGRSAV